MLIISQHAVLSGMMLTHMRTSASGVHLYAMGGWGASSCSRASLPTQMLVLHTEMALCSHCNA